MTSFQVRTAPAQQDAGADVLLDWFGDSKASSTVQYGGDFLKGLRPSPVARDLLRLGGAVFCVDKVAKRSETADGWTRELELVVPVSDVRLWEAARDHVHRALDFLSGDHWQVSFVDDSDAAEPAERTDGAAAVSLFSGGLDSLSGVIDLLETGHDLLLVGHHDSSLTDNRQRDLFAELQAHYGPDRVALRRLLLRPAAASASQARPLPAQDEGENTMRSRSFLFFAAGIAVADGIGARVPLYVPENGFIGINVPLTASRAGSLSTRTTHPLYMHRMAALLEQVGLDHRLENPYRLLTKGEALAQNANRNLLVSLAPRSVSCSHPETARWRKRPQGNCGYCYPCLIRRASMHHIGQDRVAEYAWDALTDTDLLQRDWNSGASLRSLAQSLSQPERPVDVMRNGRIPGGETHQFFEVYRRGREELRAWFASGAGPELRRRLGMA
jgi:7-cyano-7-deazaguanine synthase in queuosine biosynthesis